MGTISAAEAMRVVLDTNILVSRALSPYGLAARILKRLNEGDFEITTTADILAEYWTALHYESVQRRSGLSDEEIEEILDPFAEEETEPAAIDPICRDPKDDQFLAAAVGGEADYIVTCDDDLLTLGSYQGIMIMSPGTFLRILDVAGG